MTTKVNLPKSGMGIEEGTIVRWLKTVGQSVQKGEALAELETAKATMEVESPASGTLSKILVSEGQSAPVNTAIAEIEHA